MVYIPIGADIVDEAGAGKKKKNPLVPDPKKSSKTQLLKGALSPKQTTYGQRLVGIAEGTLAPPQPKTPASSVVGSAKSGVQSLGIPTQSMAAQVYTGSQAGFGGARAGQPSQTTQPATQTQSPAYQSTAQSSPSTTSQHSQTLQNALGTAVTAAVPGLSLLGSGIDSLIQGNNDLISRMTETGNAQIQQLNSFYTGLLSQIENMRRDLIARSERDQQELDPATMHTLDLLRESAQENLRRVKEEANRRGILDSGIALGMEQESDKAFQQAEAGILSDRLSRLKEQLDAQLTRLQEMAFGVQRDQGQNVFDAQRDLENRLMQARQYGDTRLDTALDRDLRTRDQLLREALANAEVTGRYVNPQAQSLVNQILQAKERNATGQDPQAAAQADVARRQLTAMGIDANALFGPNVSLEQAYRNAATIGQPMIQVRQEPSSPVQTNLNTATRNALVIAQQYPDRETALAEIQAQLPGFMAAGVDLEAVMNAINQLPSRTTTQTRHSGLQLR